MKELLPFEVLKRSTDPHHNSIPLDVKSAVLQVYARQLSEEETIVVYFINDDGVLHNKLIKFQKPPFLGFITPEVFTINNIEETQKYIYDNPPESGIMNVLIDDEIMTAYISDEFELR